MRGLGRRRTRPSLTTLVLLDSEIMLKLFSRCISDSRSPPSLQHPRCCKTTYDYAVLRFVSSKEMEQYVKTCSITVCRRIISATTPLPLHEFSPRCLQFVRHVPWRKGMFPSSVFCSR